MLRVDLPRKFYESQRLKKRGTETGRYVREECFRKRGSPVQKCRGNETPGVFPEGSQGPFGRTATAAVILRKFSTGN